MASPIPSPKKLRQIRLDILRSVYYKQDLPRRVFLTDADWVQAEQTNLLKRKLIETDESKAFVLTELGLSVLKELAGGRIPSMIQIDREIFLDKKRNKKFIVGRSLAKEIFREVSIGG